MTENKRQDESTKDQKPHTNKDEVSIDVSYSYSVEQNPSIYELLQKPTRHSNLTVNLCAANLDETFTKLRDQEPELRGMSAGRITTMALYEFLKKRNIDLKMSSRSLRNLKKMYKYLGIDI